MVHKSVRKVLGFCFLNRDENQMNVEILIVITIFKNEPG